MRRRRSRARASTPEKSSTERAASSRSYSLTAIANMRCTPRASTTLTSRSNAASASATAGATDRATPQCRRHAAADRHCSARNGVNRFRGCPEAVRK